MMSDDDEGVARMPSYNNDDGNDGPDGDDTAAPVSRTFDRSSWEGRIVMPMEESYGGKVVEQDIIAWTKPQFKRTKFCFSPDYKPSVPGSSEKLREDLKASSLKEGFSICSKGKRGKGYITEVFICSHGRKDIGRKGGKRQRSCKGCCTFNFSAHMDLHYDRYFIKGGTGDPHHCRHGRDNFGEKKASELSRTRQVKVPKLSRATVRDPFWPPLQVSREIRWKDHSGAVIWFTGLSGSGKSTIANEAEYILNRDKGMRTYTLDGDEIRKGLCRDLGFDRASRKENLRRVGEVAKLMADAGNIVLCAFVSPYRIDREFVRLTCEAAGIPFFEVYVKADLAVCERRDPKGLYVKARAGLVQGLTGVDAPYEEPLEPDLVLESGAKKKSNARFLARELVAWVGATNRVQCPGFENFRR